MPCWKRLRRRSLTRWIIRTLTLVKNPPGECEIHFLVIIHFFVFVSLPTTLLSAKGVTRQTRGQLEVSSLSIWWLHKIIRCYFSGLSKRTLRVKIYSRFLFLSKDCCTLRWSWKKYMYWRFILHLAWVPSLWSGPLITTTKELIGTTQGSPCP